MKNYETLPGSGLSSISLGSVDRGCPALCGLRKKIKKLLQGEWKIMKPCPESESRMDYFSPHWAVWTGVAPLSVD
jgi:hypothetical protein